MPLFTRVILLVLDGVGCGELPDAAAFGDAGSDTLGHLAARGLRVPHLRALGLDRIVAFPGAPAGPLRGAFGRMAEASCGKDSVTGHWELMGVVLDRPFPTFPHGFPADLVDEFERRIGRRTIGNEVASGTEIIARLGDAHVQTGAPIVYTSADSVFQVAAHEAVIPLEEQRRICRAAYTLAVDGRGIGRVISRPFTGTSGAYVRTANRRDYTQPPPYDTLLDRLAGSGVAVISIGKVYDLFAGRGITSAVPTRSDAEGLDQLAAVMASLDRGLVFVNLVECDTVYGHRNDAPGFAAHLERIDARLPPMLDGLRPTDLLIVTADHGNDPTTPGTDHSREYVPLLVAGPRVWCGADLGTRATFADVGQTLAGIFGVDPLSHGTSFLTFLTGDLS